MILEIENNRTYILQSDPFILDRIDECIQYSTVFAGEEDQQPDWLPVQNAWDGIVRFLHRPKTMHPWFPTGLLLTVYRVLHEHGYDCQFHDKRIRPQEGFPELVKISLRDYQREAVDRALAMGRGVLDIVPRGGKTRMACEIQRSLALPTIWIVPTDGIARQTKRVLDDFFYDSYSYHLIGSSNSEKLVKAEKAPVVVCTAVTAANLENDFYAGRECVIIDEFHHSGARTYKTIFDKCEHVYFRYGLTGTFFRSGGDEMSMHAHLSETIYKVSSGDLLRAGYLVPTHVAFLPVDQRMPRSSDGPLSKNFFTGHGKYGIHEFHYRNDLVSQAAYWLSQYGYKVLVLVGTKKQGRILQEMIGQMFPTNRGTEFRAVEFVSTDKRRYVQSRIIDAFVETGEIRVLIGTSLIGEGMDLPTADALVYARGERAEVSHTQNVYRVCTAVEGKSHAVIVDFADRHNKKLLEHSQQRLDTYYDEPIFNVDILSEVREFTGWLDGLGDRHRDKVK